MTRAELDEHMALSTHSLAKFKAVILRSESKPTLEDLEARIKVLEDLILYKAPYNIG